MKKIFPRCSMRRVFNVLHRQLRSCKVQVGNVHYIAVSCIFKKSSSGSTRSKSRYVRLKKVCSKAEVCFQGKVPLAVVFSPNTMCVAASCTRLQPFSAWEKHGPGIFLSKRRLIEEKIHSRLCAFTVGIRCPLCQRIRPAWRFQLNRLPALSKLPRAQKPKIWIGRRTATV